MKDDKIHQFCKWLEAYDIDYIDKSTADKCLKILHSKASQDCKDNALAFLSYYDNWTPAQLRNLFLSYPKLNEYNQEQLVDVQMCLNQEDLSPKAAKVYVQNLWLLLSGTPYNDVAEWAADDMCEYAHPFCLNKAIKHYNNNKHRWKRYFARNYFWSWNLEYKEVKKWKHKQKAEWIEKSAAWLPSPKWCLGDRPIYVYIFTVSKYPDKWGDISLPGCAKDNLTYQDLFREIATEGIEFYEDDQATTEQYFKCIASMADKEDDAIHIFCNSHHGAWDEAGHHCQLLYDFDYDYDKHIFINTPTAKDIHLSVDTATIKSPNILPIFIGDYCGSGGVATERAMAPVTDRGLKIKSFHPEGWVPPTIPSTLFEGIKRNSREIWMSACRPQQFSYDSPDGGMFTLSFASSFDVNKNISKIMKQTGKKLMKQGIPAVPWLVCSAGRQRFKFKTKS